MAAGDGLVALAGLCFGDTGAAIAWDAVSHMEPSPWGQEETAQWAGIAMLLPVAGQASYPLLALW